MVRISLQTRQAHLYARVGFLQFGESIIQDWSLSPLFIEAMSGLDQKCPTRVKTRAEGIYYFYDRQTSTIPDPSWSPDPSRSVECVGEL